MDKSGVNLPPFSCSYSEQQTGYVDRKLGHVLQIHACRKRGA